MSEIKVNKISPKQLCTQVTLGDSGDTFIIPAGVTLQNSGTATGFGQTFDATVKTSNFNAASNTGYVVDTTSGIITATLSSSPTFGDQVTFLDYAGTFDNNNFRINPNGKKIDGDTLTYIPVDVSRQAIILTYSDSSQGWLITSGANPSVFAAPTITFITAAGTLGTIAWDNLSGYTLSTAAATASYGGLTYTIQSGALPGGLTLNSTTAAITGTATAVAIATTFTFTVRATSTVTATVYADRTFSIYQTNPPQYVTATGGTVLTSGNYKTHVFTGSDNFVVTNVGDDRGSNSVEYIVVAGGGSGGNRFGGGGGAGGYRTNFPSPAFAGLPVTATTYPVSVAGGGGGSSFSSIGTNAGGPGGNGDSGSGNPGGSGGGGSGRFGAGGGGGNAGGYSPPEGNPGGSASPGVPFVGMGGGGASASGGGDGDGRGGTGRYVPDGFFGPTAPSYGAPGPVGSTRYFAGGGGGGASGDGGPSTGADGGAGGGAQGGPVGGNGSSGQTNTGGGGGGGPYPPTSGGGGGSGIVIIRYKYQ